VADELAIDLDPASGDLLQVVDATQQGGLTGTGWSDQAGHRALRDLKVDALEHVEAAVILPHIAESNHGDVHRLFSVTLSSYLMEILHDVTTTASVKAASWREVSWREELREK